MTLYPNQIPQGARLEPMTLEEELELCKKKCELLSDHLIRAMALIHRLEKEVKNVPNS